MGIFDSIKAAASQAQQSMTAASSSTAAKLWAAHKDMICDTILSYIAKAAKSGGSYVADDSQYRAYVIDPAWDLLPLPIRMIGRERLRWDKTFYAARSKLLVIDGDTVSLHPDAHQRLEQLLASGLANDQQATIALEIGEDAPACDDQPGS